MDQTMVLIKGMRFEIFNVGRPLSRLNSQPRPAEFKQKIRNVQYTQHRASGSPVLCPVPKAALRLCNDLVDRYTIYAPIHHENEMWVSNTHQLQPRECSFSFSISFPIVTLSCKSRIPFGCCSKKLITT